MTVEPDLSAAYCPHCQLRVETAVSHPWPPQVVPCPHCELVIGPGRTLRAPSEEPGARGAAAGVISNNARRDSEQQPVDPATVRAAIRAVAEAVDRQSRNVLMVDYQVHAAADPELPTLSQVLATFGSWKQARREAAAEDIAAG